MTVPVPLTDLLAKADDQADDLGIVIVYPEQVRALCEALRIAVEAAENAHEELWHHDTRAAWPLEVALAAVRELVDLGGDDG